VQPLHNRETLEGGSLTYWRDRDTHEIIESLAPAAIEPLRVKSDGTIMDGNTRIAVLRERGYDVESLPRAVHSSGEIEP